SEEVAGIRLPRDGHPITYGGREAGRRNLGDRSQGGPAPDPGSVDAVRGPGHQPDLVTSGLRCQLHHRILKVRGVVCVIQVLLWPPRPCVLTVSDVAGRVCGQDPVYEPGPPAEFLVGDIEAIVGD